jgi:DNA primase
MAKIIPEEIVEQVKTSNSIVDVVGKYVNLKRSGSNWTACCPFHNEKTPSFFVDPTRNMYKCFGCGESGDLIKFIMEKENLDFLSAVEMLANIAGIYIPEDTSDSYSPNKGRSRDKKKRLYEVCDSAASFYTNNILNNDQKVSAVLDYLYNRPIPPDTIRKFRIGASSQNWNDLMDFLKTKGFSNEEMEEAGLIKKNKKNDGYHDQFRNRLIFSITDEQGKVVGFSARVVTKEFRGGKYINTQETPIYKKSKLLFALSYARKAIKEMGYAILAEGQVDTIAMHIAAYENTIAPLGTAFTEEQAKILARYTDTVYIAFDADNAGKKATIKAISMLLKMGVKLRVIN